MGSLTSPSASGGQWTQLFLDTNAATDPNNSLAVVTMTTYAAAGLDLSQALGVEVMLEYAVAIAGTISEWILTLNETLQGAGALLVDQLPANSGAHHLTNNGYAKLRFMLQSAPIAGTTYIDGFQQDSVILVNSALTNMTAFGILGGGVNSAIPTRVAIDLTKAFTLQLTSQATGGGVGGIALNHLYTRYYRIGP